jgi:prepilin-type N-terminal cleavage/methylation domain-containing protein
MYSSSAKSALPTLSSPASHAGFSLVEVIVVIILLGILSVVALPRLFDTTDFDTANFHEDAINAFRYAQKTAIASGCDVEVSLLASGSFALNFRSGGTATSCGTGAFSEPVIHPQMQGNFSGTAPATVTVSNDLVVSFNAEGVPSSGGSATIGFRSITVEPITGFVH